MPKWLKAILVVLVVVPVFTFHAAAYVWKTRDQW